MRKPASEDSVEGGAFDGSSSSAVEPTRILWGPDGGPQSSHEPCAAFRLRKATRRVTQIYDASLAEVGLTITQYGVLAHARMHPNTSIKRFADILYTDPTTLTRVLRPLIGAGLIALRAELQDRRVRRITLTPKGQSRLTTAYPLWQRAQKAMRDALGDCAMNNLIASLDLSVQKLSSL